jgi:hypothetical protein
MVAAKDSAVLVTLRNRREIISSRSAVILVFPNGFGFAAEQNANDDRTKRHSNQQASVRRKKARKHVQHLPRSTFHRASDRAITSEHRNRR